MFILFKLCNKRYIKTFKKVNEKTVENVIQECKSFFMNIQDNLDKIKISRIDLLENVSKIKLLKINLHINLYEIKETLD